VIYREMDRKSASGCSRAFVPLPGSHALDVHSLGLEASTRVRANDNSGD
jgi:hypothetical protein